MGPALNVLIVSRKPEPERRQYYDYVRAKFPAMTVNVVDHHDKVGPYVGSADVIMTFNSYITDDVLRDAPNLKWIHALTTGTDKIDRLPSLRPEVLLTSGRGIHGAPMSEAALLAMLALSRKLPIVIRNQDRRAWERPMPRLLEGKTVGIFGLGVIGSALAPRCKALGMHVIGVDPLKPVVAGVDRVHGWEDATRVIGEMDFVVIFIPASPKTRGIFNAELLAAMKPTGYLVNLGRGEVVDDGALIDALRSGRIAGAALDVFNPEPLPEDHAYWSLPNIIITPHMGGTFDEYPQSALPLFEENMRRFLAGDTQHMINLVTH